MLKEQTHVRRDSESLFRAWRRRVGVDIATAAKMLGKSKRAVEYYEAGREPPVETLKFMQLIATSGARDVAPWGHADADQG